jgi:hypothetical protein
MNINEYIIYDTLEECEASLAEINNCFNFKPENTTSNWSEPILHPTDQRCLLDYDKKSLSKCEYLINKDNIISKQIAVKKGWYFGYFKGKLARERGKLEDLQFIFDSVLSHYGKPNFPAARAIILSYLSSCYSLRESLKTKIKKLDNFDLSSWWIDRQKELSKKGELLFSFEQLMNNEKHGGPLANQHSVISLVPRAYKSGLVVISHPIDADPRTLHNSAEGAFMTAYAGTPKERRFPVGLHEARYEIIVENPPNKHLGVELTDNSLLGLLSLIKDYYENLVFESELIIGERKNNSSPAILFDGNASMSVKE